MSLIYGLSDPKGYSAILRVILPLDNILYHKHVPMIMQTLGSTANLYLRCSPIAHSITLIVASRPRCRC